MKGGIIFADQVTTVSPTYAREIQTHEHGAGLDGVLRSLSFKLHGILNGIDVEEWDPETDPHLALELFDASGSRGKNLQKRALLREAEAAAQGEDAAARRSSRVSSIRRASIC